MNSHTTPLDPHSVTLTAHDGPEGRLLLIKVTAAEVASPTDASTSVAVVIDRSGSMGGHRLEIAKDATARLIRSLRPEDRIGVVTYDGEIDILSRMAPPTEVLAREVERVECGGSTNLYGGWVTAAKMVGAGGRVILLSDGQANSGRFTDAHTLSLHAGLSYETFRVVTSTVGVGEDYDEALMAGMARKGAGGHYFAHTVDAITDAFSQERLAMGSAALSHVSVRYAGLTVQLGAVWGGETKAAVMRVSDLSGEPATIRFLGPQGKPITTPLTMPSAFGHSDEATLEALLADAAQAQNVAATVSDPKSATQAKVAVRAVMLRLLGHPLADSELASAVRGSLESTLTRLEGLERNFDALEASMHRKRSAQASHNVRERGQAFSSFEEDGVMMGTLRESVAIRLEMELRIDPRGLALAPVEQWRTWSAAPLNYENGVLRVGLTRPRDGFLIAEIERVTGARVRAHGRRIDANEIATLLAA